MTGTLQRPTPRLWLEGEYEEAENCSENIEAADVVERRDQPQCDRLSFLTTITALMLPLAGLPRASDLVITFALCFTFEKLEKQKVAQH